MNQFQTTAARTSKPTSSGEQQEAAQPSLPADPILPSAIPPGLQLLNLRRPNFSESAEPGKEISGARFQTWLKNNIGDNSPLKGFRPEDPKSVNRMRSLLEEQKEQMRALGITDATGPIEAFVRASQSQSGSQQVPPMVPLVDALINSIPGSIPGLNAKRERGRDKFDSSVTDFGALNIGAGVDLAGLFRNAALRYSISIPKNLDATLGAADGAPAFGITYSVTLDGEERVKPLKEK